MMYVDTQNYDFNFENRDFGTKIQKTAKLEKGIRKEIEKNIKHSSSQRLHIHKQVTQQK